MNVIIFGEQKEKISGLVEQAGFKIVESKPDFVVSYGGDGTVMLSEAKYPGIPKIILKNSAVCKLCLPETNQEILESVKAGKYRVEEYWKLVVVAKGENKYAINDVVIHNGDPRHAIRYNFWIDGEKMGHEIIGDGIVVATPLGSTGYYRSITDSFFELGMGLAFNNSTEQSDHMVLGEGRIIELEIIRGPALVYADNQKDAIELNVGDKVQVKKSSEIARIVRVG